MSLAQIHLELGQPAKAIALLEDPQAGPQTLLDQEDTRMADAGLAEAAYRSALRAAIAVVPSSDNPAEALEKATAIMEKLEKHVGSALGR